MSNPYQAPQQRHTGHDSRSAVRAAATSLIIVAAISVTITTLALLGDVFLLASGAVEQLEAADNRPVSRYTSIAIRMIWSVAILAASSFVLYGAVQMKYLRSYSLAKAAAIVAVIPLLGPCCLLGIPFGIWALVVLNNPAVRNDFV